MCLAVPVEVISVNGNEAEIMIGGLKRKISIALTPQAKPGDYVLLHTGYSIQIIDDAEAQETLKLFEELIKSEGSCVQNP